MSPPFLPVHLHMFDRLLQAGQARVTTLLKDKEEELHRVSVLSSIGCEVVSN
jgi:hypothetical protein